MSAEVKVKYPFPVCAECPLAQKVIALSINKNPYKTITTTTDRLFLACLVEKKKEHTPNRFALMTGLRTELWENSQGIQEAVDILSLRSDIPPDFCPQTKVDE